MVGIAILNYVLLFVKYIGLGECTGLESEMLKNMALKNQSVNVSGYVKIADKMFRATCNCPSHIRTLEDMIYRSKTLCRPSKIKVRTHNVPKGPDPELIESFKYLPPNDFVYISQQHFSSMDGRAKDKSFFCPGGDLGMFVEVLLTMFDTTQMLSESVITELLKDYLKSLGDETKFYHSTEESAVNAMSKSLQWEVLDLHNINFTNQNKVKNLLIQNVGDCYLRYLFEIYRNNSVKNKILIWSFWAFFNVLWDKSDEVNEKLLLETLTGTYNPQLLIEISVNKGCELYNIFPKVESRVGDNQVLVFSEFASNVRKSEISTFVYRYFGNLNYNFNLTLDQYLIQLSKNAYILMENFVLKYSNLIPFYNITYV